VASQSLNNLPLTGKVAFGVFIGLLLGGAFYVLDYSDTETLLARERKQSVESQAMLAQQRQSQASYVADRDELVMRQQKQRELNKALPTDAETAAFLSALQGVANISGIDLKAWAPLEETTQTFYAKVPMRLQISGRFHQIAKFVYEVGKQERIINMENLDLSEPKKEGEDVVLKANCLATTFHLIAKKEASASGAGAK